MRLHSAVIGALVLTMASAIPGADALSAPPVGGPTQVTGGSTPLSADDLVNRASTAQQAKGSVRVSSVSRSWSSGNSTETIRSQGVISFALQRYAFSSADRTVTLKGHAHRVTVKHRREILVDAVLAQRTGHGAWHCQNIQAMQDSVGGLLAALKGPGGLSVRYGTVTSTTVDNAAVWDVPLAVGPQASNLDSGLTLSEHLFISQIDFTVVRDVTTTVMSLSLNQHGKLVRISNTETTTTNYSEYGLPVSISLPAACAMTPAATAQKVPQFTYWPHEIGAGPATRNRQ